MTKRLAVIILNWNGLSLLREFIPTVAETTIGPDTDLIVADNGSTDGSCEWLQANWPQVRLLRFKENYGFAGGYNRALEQTRYPLTILLNSDVMTTPGWADTLLRYMDSHLEVGACQPKIRSYRRREEFEYAGAAGGLIDKLGYPYCYGRLFDCVETDLGQYDTPADRDVAWASGAALMVRTDLYLRLGGLDEAFFAHMEEIDLCLRIRRAGFRVTALPAAMVYHVGGASLDASNPRKTYLNFRNNLLLLHKNMPRAKSRPLLLRRRLLDTLSWAMFMAKGRFGHAAAILRAHRDFRRMRGNYTDLPDRDIFPDLPGTKRRIVIDRYLLGRKK